MYTSEATQAQELGVARIKTLKSNIKVFRESLPIFKKEKVDLYSQYEIHQSESNEVTISEPHLEHTSLPLYGTNFVQLKQLSSFNRKSTTFRDCDIAEPLQNCNSKMRSLTDCDTTLPDSIPSLTLHESMSDDSENYVRESCGNYPSVVEEPASEYTYEAVFLPDFSRTQSFYESIRPYLADRGLIPTSQNEHRVLDYQGHSSSDSTLDQKQLTFDPRISDTQEYHAGYEEFYSVEESASALAENLSCKTSQDNPSIPSEEHIRVFNLDEKSSPNSNEKKLCCTCQSTGDGGQHAAESLRSVINSPSSDHNDNQYGIAPEEDFVFDDSKRTDYNLGKKLPRVFQSNAMKESEEDLDWVNVKRDSKPFLLWRPNKLIPPWVSNKSSAQNHRDLNGNSDLTLSSSKDRGVVLPHTITNSKNLRKDHLSRIKQRIEYLEAREKSDWRRIITGLPRFLPINHHEH